LTPAHFPPALPLLPPTSCAYRKSGSNLSRMGGRLESEERNEERAGSRFIRHCRISRLIQRAVCHDTCKTAAAARNRQHSIFLAPCAADSGPLALGLKGKYHASPSPHSARHNRRLCLLPANEERRANRSGSGLDMESMVSFFDRLRKPAAGFSRQFFHLVGEVAPGRSP
jgi:hypothetical protein